MAAAVIPSARRYGFGPEAIVVVESAPAPEDADPAPLLTLAPAVPPVPDVPPVPAVPPVADVPPVPCEAAFADATSLAEGAPAPGVPGACPITAGSPGSGTWPST